MCMLIKHICILYVKHIYFILFFKSLKLIFTLLSSKTNVLFVFKIMYVQKNFSRKIYATFFIKLWNIESDVVIFFQFRTAKIKHFFLNNKARECLT